MGRGSNSLIQAMNLHATELEERGERHLYGPAISHILLLEETIDELEKKLRAYTKGEEETQKLIKKIFGDSDEDYSK